MSNVYKIHGNNILFSFKYNIEIINNIRNIPGRIYLSKSKQWVAPINLVTKNMIFDLIETYDFIGSDIKLKNEENLKLDNYGDKLSKELKLQPREYQKYAIDYMLTKRKVINGDDVGLGKTLETIFSCEIKQLYPVLVVTLNTVKEHWKRLWKETNENITVTVINSGDKNIDFTSNVLIINYDILGKKVDGKIYFKIKELENINFKAVVFDEFHKLKNSKSVRSKIALKLAKKTEYVFGLTGTVVLNKPAELISLMNILGVFNKLFGDWRGFVYRYCNAKKTRFGLDYNDASNLKELNTILKNNFYFRREKSEVLDLPKYQINIYNSYITNKKQYKTAENDIISYIKNNYSELQANKASMAEFLVLRNVLRQLSGEGKIKDIVNWVNNFQEQTNKKLLIFGVYKNTLHKLKREFNCDLIDGSVNHQEKQHIIDDFQKNNKQVLIGNINSLGTGTDGLQNVCSDMLIIELPDRPGDIEQAIGRLHRSGQKNMVNVNYMLSNQTIDKLMWDVLEDKKHITEAINKGKEFKKQDLNKLLINKYYGS